MQLLGAALATALAGLIVVGAGHGAALLMLGGVAAVTAVVCFIALPETRQMGDDIALAPGSGTAPNSAIVAG